MLRFALALATCAIGSSALAAQTYSVERFPAGSDCHAAAATLAQDFKTQTGLDASARCDSVSALGANLKVTYQAAEPLTLVSTIGSDSFADSAIGVYATAEACNAALAAEKTLFQEQTGLTALVAFCYQTDFLEVNPFVLRIDAFGTPAKRPINSWLPFWGQATEGSRAALDAQLLGTLQGRGITTSFTRVVSENDLGLLGIGYYAAEAIRFDTTEWAKLPTEEACTAALAQLAEGFTALDEAPLATFCTRHAMFPGFKVVNLTLGKSAIEATRAIETFPTYEACEADRARLVAHYRDTLGRPVAAGVCSAAEDDLLSFRTWQVVLVERP